MLPELPPAETPDPVIEHYKKDVDRTLLRENLKLTPDERLKRFIEFMRLLDTVREAGQLAEATRAAAHGK